MAKAKEKLYPAEFKKISDIVVPDQLFHPLKTNNPEMDAVLSELGGLIPSQVVMITGNPGSGKTTIAAVVGSKISKIIPNKPVVFLSYEMSDFQLKLQAKKISGFGDLLISTHEFHKDPIGMESLFKALDAIQPSLVIADSLQKMASKMPQGLIRGQITLVEMFTKWAKKTFTPVMLIGHNDKGGNYAGPAFLKHEVDSHLEIRVDKDTHERVFAMSKNRFGGNAEEYTFRITSDGVYIASEWWKVQEERTPEDLRHIVMDFKDTPSGNSINFIKFQEAASSLIDYLKKKYADRFPTSTYIKDPNRISLTWSGAYAYCAIQKGQINLGKGFFEKIKDSSWKNMGYRSEHSYIQQFASNKEEAAIWAVLHEWCHLFKGCEKHTTKMWQEISRIAAEERWLWSKFQNQAA